jgi:putative intracellular protease/amidase
MSTNVLLIGTSHGKLGDTGRDTGIYLPDLFHVCAVFLQSHCTVHVASPEGMEVPIDPGSICEEYMAYSTYVQNTQPLQSIDPEEFCAFVVLGGHGAMWDLPHHEELQRIFSNAHAQRKIIATICHGSAALIGLKNGDGTPFVQGKRLTGSSNSEEEALGLSNVMPFLLEDVLKHAGALYSCNPKWHPHIIIDGNLVTGQNPASALTLSETVYKMLNVSRK